MSLATIATRAARRPAPPLVRYPQLKLPRLELLFKDGSVCWLDQSWPRMDPLLRNLEVEGEVLSVDLRRLAPELEYEVRGVPTRDVAAVLFFELRRRYGSADAFIQAVRGVRHG